MSNQKIIELTQEELNDIKDEIKFRTTVLLTLKQLKGIPDKVNILSVHSGIQWVLLSAIIISLIGVAIKGIMK